MVLGMRRTGMPLIIGLVAALTLLAGSAPVTAAASKDCRPVVNPYPGTRYEGIDLTGIKADGIRCKHARHVAKGAHRKGLAMTPPPSGIRSYRWHRWSITGDLRPIKDRYVAKRDGNRVRWRF